MSDLKANVIETKDGFHVEGYEKIEYDFTFVDDIFDISKSQLAGFYKKWVSLCSKLENFNGTSQLNVFGTLDRGVSSP
jgi:hypothetical protein